MDYWTRVATVVEAHKSELEADLELARHERARLQTQMDDADNRVARLEALLALVDEPDPVDPQSKGLTLHEAMVAVLRQSPEGMLRAADLASAITNRRLYRMRDGRPVEAQQLHARVAHYPQLLAKRGTFICLADEAPQS